MFLPKWNSTWRNNPIPFLWFHLLLLFWNKGEMLKMLVFARNCKSGLDYKLHLKPEIFKWTRLEYQQWNSFASCSVGVSLLNAFVCLMTTVIKVWFVWYDCFQVNAMGEWVVFWWRGLTSFMLVHWIVNCPLSSVFPRAQTCLMGALNILCCLLTWWNLIILSSLFTWALYWV